MPASRAGGSIGALQLKKNGADYESLYEILYYAEGRESRRSGHPWVYAEEITNIEGEYRNGDLVDVVTGKGKYLGTGFVNDIPRSGCA